MARLTLHVGLHKTGTTTLQRYVFPSVAGIVYAGRPVDHVRLRTVAFTDASLPLLYSDEGLLCSLREHYIDPAESLTTKRIRSLERLRERDVQILMGLRAPPGTARSIYAHYVKYGGSLTVDRFFGRAGRGVVSLQDLLLGRLVRRAVELFGPRVHFYFQEELARRPSSTIQRIAGFVGGTAPDTEHVPQANRRAGSRGESLCRLINRVDSGTFLARRQGTGWLPLTNAFTYRLGINPYGLCRHIPVGRSDTTLSAMIGKELGEEAIRNDMRDAIETIASIHPVSYVSA